jgi:NAD(P)-dependent dehydrogenase (short-subunit alcohol dehydrogenase family)
VENAGQKFQFLQTSLTNADAPQAIVAACQKAFGGRIDALINVAGILDGNSGAGAVTDEDWDRVIAVNLTAPVRLMREVIKVMKEQKSGSIVNVSSKAGTSGAVAGVAYTASKHGLVNKYIPLARSLTYCFKQVGVTKNTAWLYKDDGIRCNAITPGGTHESFPLSNIQSYLCMSIASRRYQHPTKHQVLGHGSP